MGEENSVQLKSLMQSDATDLALLENACVPEYNCNDWVRSDVDRIVIDTNEHSQASPNDGEANVENNAEAQEHDGLSNELNSSVGGDEVQHNDELGNTTFLCIVFIS
ncbi:hypothetical protein HAX54_052093 [Datura stramonium]|uniref:Uncharacterized protein n=1 Tax=Datura stramonium TaxID=4076 RepID=A0ABS8SYH6_DATST|nr:hypothetical protein [Datura stramonium]